MAKRKRKFDAIKTINRALDRAINKMGMPPKPQKKSRSFFDLFMNEVTGAPKRPQR